jgi:hypothetical protein
VLHHNAQARPACEHACRMLRQGIHTHASAAEAGNNLPVLSLVSHQAGSPASPLAAEVPTNQPTHLTSSAPPPSVLSQELQCQLIRAAAAALHPTET